MQHDWGRYGELGGLAETIYLALQLRDTAHPLFHGSWDWHSAVHGHWALLKWLRTQDPPCPWYRDTEAKAKEHLGEAEVASWG